MTLPVEKLVQLNNTLKNYSLEERARLYNLKTRPVQMSLPMPQISFC